MTGRFAELLRQHPKSAFKAEMHKLEASKCLRSDTAPVEADKSEPPAATDEIATSPLVWGLTTDDADERNQILNLARALHWPFREKPLRFGSMSALPNLVLADSPISLDRAGTPGLRPPWPDFVISSGQQSVPVARWVRRCSGRQARLIHIGCPRVPLGLFDLVITTRQFALPPRANVLLNAMSLNWIAPGQLCKAACLWSERLTNLPRPRIAVVIDGRTPTHVLNRKSAGRLAREVADQAFHTNGSIMVTAGRETPRDILRTVLDSIPPEIPLDAWLGEGDDPYHAYLAFANRIVVAGHSAAVLSEACTTGKPVQLFELSEQTSLRSRIVRACRNFAGQKVPTRHLFGTIHDRLVELGVIALSPRTRMFHEHLVAQGFLAPFGQANQVPVAATFNESICRAVWRVRKLWLEERPIGSRHNAPFRHGS